MSWLANALVVVVVSIALGALSKAGKVPAEFRDGKSWLEYSRTFKIFTTVGIMIPAGLIVVLLNVDTKEIFAVSFLMLLFGTLTVPLFLEAMFVKIGFDDTTIYCRSPWRASRQIPFSEVGEPKLTESLQWWVIPTKNNGKIRLQEFLPGKDDLLRKINQSRGV